MADAYARVTSKVPVVTAQNSPVATLLVAGMSECLTASIQMVALVQDVGPSCLDRNAFQKLDQIELFKGVSKWTKRVTSADRIEDYVDMAFSEASSGRPGPVALLVSMDLLSEKEEKPVPNRKACLGHYPLDRTCANPVKIAEAAALLVNAKALIIYASGGVLGSHAQDEIGALQELAHLPVATTTMGKGNVDERHPLSMGIIGYYMATSGMAKFMKSMVEEADVILLIGNRTNQIGTDSWSLLPKNATYIHIDIDNIEIGRNYEALRLNGDAKLSLQALNKVIAEEDLNRRQAARGTIKNAIKVAKKSSSRRNH